MKPIIAFLLILALTISCSSRKDVIIPPEIIPQDSMTALLVDMYLSESMLSNINSRYDSLKKFRREQLDGILKENQVSRARFDSSYHFYETHLELLQKIQDDVVIELTKRKDE